MRFYFGLVILALVFAAMSGAAMSWDGSYVLFKILDLQSPFPVHNRFVNIPLHWVVLLVNRFTSNLSILQTVFGLVHAAIPFVALAISWWIVRDSARHLFVWVALGFGFGTLPGQLCFVCEAIWANLLFWPVILAILTRMRKHHSFVIILLIIIIFFAHPISVMFFAIGSVLAFTIGLYYKNERNWMLIWAFGLSAMAVLRVILLLISKSGYEMNQLTINILVIYFNVSVSRLLLIALICSWFVGFLLIFPVLLRKQISHRSSSTIHLIALITIVMAGCLLAIWARDPGEWMYAVAFRLFPLFASIPFILFSIFDSIIYGDNSFYNQQYEWNHRLRTVQVIGVVFLLVLSIQSTSWFNLTKILRESITQSEDACISLSSIVWLTRTPLDFYATPSYSILLQGRAPQKLVLDGDGCTEASFSQAVRISPYDSPFLRSRAGGWFDLSLSGLLPREEQ